MAVVYGDNQIIEDIRSVLYAQAEGLRVAMAAGYAPFPAAVYSSHEQVKMTLPAISVGLVGAKLQGESVGRSAGASPAVSHLYEILCDIRIHTDYEGGYRDEVKISRLVNSMANWLTAHDNLAITGLCYFEITGMSFNEEIAESLTIGGKLELTIVLQLLHNQA